LDLVGARTMTTAVLASVAPRLKPKPNPAVALVGAARPYQWVKNLACLAGLLFSGQLLDPGAATHALLAVVGFSLAASAVYLVNDYLDRERDRANPRTAVRPLASGALPVWLAASEGATLAAVSAIVSVRLGLACVWVLSAYAGLNLAYALRLKRTVIADVMVIATGFVLRVLYGVYAVDVLPSSWIVLCMFFLALFLGFCKRRAELATAVAGERPGATRPVLSKYTVGYLDMILGMTATLTICSGSPV
jgi:4-hydroxybenzoate polyprenyltransferase